MSSPRCLICAPAQPPYMVTIMHWATPKERQALGQARRKQVKRSDHSLFHAKSRLTPALTLLDRSMKGRIPALVKVKYERMILSPFGYFRGAVPVMAADLATAPNTGLTAQLCGDAHVRNLGAYAAEDGRLIFDLNDFDETIHGPFEWDLKRMAASLVLAGREAGDKESACLAAAVACVESYAEQMRAFAPVAVLDLTRAEVIRVGHVQPVHLALHKAVRATPLHTMQQFTEPAADLRRQFKENKPILTRVTGVKARSVLASLGEYLSSLESQRAHFIRQYRPMDVAFKVVGTGSVGLRDYVVYLEGNGDQDPLFLQIKEAVASAYAPYLTDPGAARHQGQRVVEGQRMMQRGSDVFLGWTTIAGHEYLVRQLCDHKASIEIPDLAGDGLVEYARLAGELLARGHARSGDAWQISGYIGSGEGFADSIATWGQAYANQTVKDWNELKKSRK